MSIQKKSLISTLKTTKKANVASSEVNAKPTSVTSKRADVASKRVQISANRADVASKRMQVSANRAEFKSLKRR